MDVWTFLFIIFILFLFGSNKEKTSNSKEKSSTSVDKDISTTKSQETKSSVQQTDEPNKQIQHLGHMTPSQRLELLRQLTIDIDKNEQAKKTEDSHAISAKKVVVHLSSGQQAIYDEVRSRDIQNLMHFTSLQNLNTILHTGLFSRSALYHRSISYDYNDYLRIDGHQNGICLSISFPNYKMFWITRQKYQDRKWCVLVLDPAILWEKNCAFFPANAASNRCRTMSVNTRKDVNALRELFTDCQSHVCSGKSLRINNGLPNNYPTNPQAEVICFDAIESTYIKEVVFMNKQDMMSFCTIPQIKTSANDSVFKYRKDYEEWR